MHDSQCLRCVLSCQACHPFQRFLEHQAAQASLESHHYPEEVGGRERVKEWRLEVGGCGVGRRTRGTNRDARTSRRTSSTIGTRYTLQRWKEYQY